jgi:ABC-type glycerol-3-phosphate transport system permease component
MEGNISNVPAHPAGSPQPTSPSVRARWVSRLKGMSLHLILIAGSLIFLLPFIWAVSTSLKQNSEVFMFPPEFIPDAPQWRNYPDALTSIPFGRYTLNTLLLASLRIVGNILSCTLVAFSFARLKWKGRDAVFFLVLATMMVPEEVTLIPQYIIYSKLGWVNTYLPLTVPNFFATAAFYVFLLRQFFMTIPRELDDAARVDGASYFQVYWRIILPLSAPALVTIGIFTFQNSWNAFFGPLIYLQDRSLYTVSLGLSLFQEQYYTDWTLLMAASVSIMIPTLVVFFLLQKRFIEGVTFTGLKG